MMARMLIAQMVPDDVSEPADSWPTGTDYEVEKEKGYIVFGEDMSKDNPFPGDDSY